MQSVLHALQQREREGIRQLQDAERLLSQKAALARSSLTLLGCHCSHTLQPSAAALFEGNASSSQQAAAQLSGNRDVEARPQSRRGCGALEAENLKEGNQLITCKGLRARLKGSSCEVRVVMQDSSRLLDLQQVQILVSSRQAPLTACASLQPCSPQNAQHASSSHVHSARASSDVEATVSLDVCRVAAVSEHASMDLLAVAPYAPCNGSRGSSEMQRQCTDASASGRRTGHSAQLLDSLQLDWVRMLQHQQTAPLTMQSTEVGMSDAHEDDLAADDPSAATARAGPGAGCGSTACKAAGKGTYKACLCLEAVRGSVSDVPGRLQASLGLSIESQTGMLCWILDLTLGMELFHCPVHTVLLTCSSKFGCWVSSVSKSLCIRRQRSGAGVHGRQPIRDCISWHQACRGDHSLATGYHGHPFGEGSAERGWSSTRHKFR